MKCSCKICRRFGWYALISVLLTSVLAGLATFGYSKLVVHKTEPGTMRAQKPGETQQQYQEYTEDFINKSIAHSIFSNADFVLYFVAHSAAFAFIASTITALIAALSK